MGQSKRGNSQKNKREKRTHNNSNESIRKMELLVDF
jgi:hypothetical protein